MESTVWPDTVEPGPSHHPILSFYHRIQIRGVAELSTIIPTKQLPGISSLIEDYFYAFGKVDEFYNGDFRDPTAFQNQMEKVKSRTLPRKKVAATLKAQNQKYGCGVKTQKNINKLLDQQTYAVVTGQQVGLFSGPLYTIYKTLTAIKLAQYLNQNSEVCVVPIFWMASDDHDFQEINHIHILDKNNQIQKIQYASETFADRIPASNILLTSNIERCLQELDVSTHDTEFKKDVLYDLSDAYQSGRSFADAFAVWMTRLFKSHGLIFMDASHPDFKALGKQVFHQEIAEDSPSTQQALEASGKLHDKNYKSQIQLHDGILNVFFVDRQRQTIKIKDSDFYIKGIERAVTKTELLDQVETSPHRFSPNVLLRPMYQDALLPTVAYIGGPSEIAYFAQMKGIYECFNLPMPVVYPRKTVTLLENRMDRILSRYALTVPDMWQNVDRIITKIVKRQIPESIGDALNAATSHIQQDFASIKKEVAFFEPTLEQPVMRTLGKLNHQLHALERKIQQASKNKNEVVTRQIQTVHNRLYPDNRLQERVFNIVPILMKHGYTVADRLIEAINIECHDHQVIRL